MNANLNIRNWLGASSEHDIVLDWLVGINDKYLCANTECGYQNERKFNPCPECGSQDSISVTQKLQQPSKQLFKQKQDAYKFAISMGIHMNSNEKSITLDKNQTKKIWNTSVIDPDGSIKELCTSIFADYQGDPYVLVETLASIGLDQIKQFVDQQTFSFTEILSQIK